MSSTSCFGKALQASDHVVTVALMVVLLMFSMASELRAEAREALVLIWNHTFMTQFYVWNIVSSSFVETSFVKLLISFLGIIGMGPSAEESLGHAGLGVLLLLVAVASGVVTSSGIFILYVITRREYLLDLEIHGSFGIIVALSVAIAQREPGASLLPGNATPWFPKRYFPIVLVSISAVCRALSLPGPASDFPFAVVGGFAAWVHLRFLGHIIHGGPTGDVSDEFQLVLFFPPFLHRFLKPLFDFAYEVFLLMGFFKERAGLLPAIGGQDDVDLALAAVSPTLERQDPIAERRRARAMKLLDEKFAKLNAKPLHRWDDEEQGGAGRESFSGSGLMGSRDASPPSQSKSGTDIDHGDDDRGWGMSAVHATEDTTFNGESSKSSR